MEIEKNNNPIENADVSLQGPYNQVRIYMVIISPFLQYKSL
jgi:hypothetical protein